MTTINTPGGIEAYRLLVIASALEMYARTGMKANRAYTPKAMMEAAENATGVKFTGKGKYYEAATALREMAVLKAAGEEYEPRPEDYQT